MQRALISSKLNLNLIKLGVWLFEWISSLGISTTHEPLNKLHISLYLMQDLSSFITIISNLVLASWWFFIPSVHHSYSYNMPFADDYYKWNKFYSMKW